MKFWIFAVTILQFVSVAHSAEESQQVFPIVSVQQPGAIPFISTYAKEQKLKPLQPNHLRLFVQPFGIIDSAFDVDLGSGAIIRYPGTHDNKEIQKAQFNERELASLVTLLESKKFQEIPKLNDKVGLDGATYFLEADWKEKYTWKLHWHPDDSLFPDIEKRVRESFEK